MEATGTLQELGERFLANKKETRVFQGTCIYITCVEVTRTLHYQVLQGILPINKDNKLNEKVPLAFYHTEVTAELRNWLSRKYVKNKLAIFWTFKTFLYSMSQCECFLNA